MSEKKDKIQISIRNIIIIVFIVSMIASVVIIGNVVFSNWIFSAKETTGKIAEDINDQIFHQIDTFIQVPEHVNEVNQKLIQNGILELTNDTERENFFVGVLNSHNSEIYSFSYGTENGEYYGARRNENGVIQIMRNNANTGGNSWYYSVNEDMTSGDLVVRAGKFDPRTRDWYQAAKEAKGPVFSPIYKHFVMDDLTVSAAWPIYDKNGDLQGVLGTHMILSNIDKYLQEIVQDNNGIAVILEKNTEELIANSFGMKNFQTLEDGTIQRLRLNKAENQTIIQAYEQYKSSKEDRIVLDNGSDSLYFNFTEYHKDGLDWVVITEINDSVLMADIYKNMEMTVLFIILIVLISAAVYYILTKTLIKPINTLIEATERLSSGDLSQKVPIMRNDEIGRISKSFNKMADTIHTFVNDLEAKVKDRTVELEFLNNALSKTKEELRLILDSTAEAIYGVDKEGNCTFCNASCIKILGYEHQDDLIRKNMHSMIHHSNRDGTSMPIQKCKIIKAFLEGIGTHADDEVFWRADGTSFDVEYYSYPQFKDGEVIGAVVTFMDNTDRKKTEEQIKYLSCHDSLTGLHNRMCFEDALKKIDTKENLPISIVFGDVNGLKLTNDIFGHRAGDELIIKSAEILKRVCREEDIVARVGGDEFIIILPHTAAFSAEKIANRAKRELSKEKIDAVQCSMSMGISCKTDPDQNIEQIMVDAENKMYKEKTMNRNAVKSDMIHTIIGTLHAKSPEEKRHSINVSKLCQNIGYEMNLSQAEIKKLKEAGYLHDIGKIVLEEKIINKITGLTEQEKKEMQQHPIVGYRILNLFDDTLDFAEGIYSHHEKWDGSGYPKGLKGEEIPLLARIISVAESYDRMVHHSGDGLVATKTEAIQTIRDNAGKQFDPQVADLFIRSIID